MFKNEGLKSRTSLRQKINKAAGFIATGGYSIIEPKNKSLETKYPEIGVYEHFKSTPENPRLYYVIGCRPSFPNTLEEVPLEEALVVYMALYDVGGNSSSLYSDRPVSEFMGNVRIDDGSEVPRFRKLEIK